MPSTGGRGGPQLPLGPPPSCGQCGRASPWGAGAGPHGEAGGSWVFLSTWSCTRCSKPASAAAQSHLGSPRPGFQQRKPVVATKPNSRVLSGAGSHPRCSGEPCGRSQEARLPATATCPVPGLLPRPSRRLDIACGHRSGRAPPPCRGRKRAAPSPTELHRVPVCLEHPGAGTSPAQPSCRRPGDTACPCRAHGWQR